MQNNKRKKGLIKASSFYSTIQISTINNQIEAIMIRKINNIWLNFCNEIKKFTENISENIPNSTKYSITNKFIFKDDYAEKNEGFNAFKREKNTQNSSEIFDIKRSKSISSLNSTTLNENLEEENLLFHQFFSKNFEKFVDFVENYKKMNFIFEINLEKSLKNFNKALKFEKLFNFAENSLEIFEKDFCFKIERKPNLFLQKKLVSYKIKKTNIVENNILQQRNFSNESNDLNLNFSNNFENKEEISEFNKENEKEGTFL